MFVKSSLCVLHITILLNTFKVKNKHPKGASQAPCSPPFLLFFPCFLLTLSPHSALWNTWIMNADNLSWASPSLFLRLNGSWLHPFLCSQIWVSEFVIKLGGNKSTSWECCPSEGRLWGGPGHSKSNTVSLHSINAGRESYDSRFFLHGETSSPMGLCITAGGSSRVQSRFIHAAGEAALCGPLAKANRSTKQNETLHIIVIALVRVIF